jgi:two-component system, LuxR family, response regulator FixJ
MNGTLFAIGSSLPIAESLAHEASRHGLTYICTPHWQTFVESFSIEEPGCVVLFSETARDLLHAVDRLHDLDPAPQFIVVAHQPTMEFVVRCMQRGAVTVIEAGAAGTEISSAVALALDHDHDKRSTSMRRAMVRQRWNELTIAERQVLTLMLGGEPNKLIAKRLDVSQRTIESRRSKIYEKMGAQSLAELIRLVAELGELVHEGLNASSVGRTNGQSVDSQTNSYGNDLFQSPEDRI